MVKILFLLLLAAFGAVMFIAGALAPASLKAPLEHAAAVAEAKFSGHVQQASALAASKSAIAGASSTASAATPKEPAHASSASAPFAASTPLANLLVPVPPPTNGHYALQAATFASSSPAALFAASLNEQGFKAIVVPISDSGQPFVVAVGDYPSAQAASDDQLTIGRSLKSNALPPVILLPPPAH
jgi:cell division septation protein DedD